jgi:hypothetical protein
VVYDVFHKDMTATALASRALLTGLRIRPPNPLPPTPLDSWARAFSLFFLDSGILVLCKKHAAEEKKIYRQLGKRVD